MKIDTFTYYTEDDTNEFDMTQLLFGRLLRPAVTERPSCQCESRVYPTGQLLLMACEAGQGDTKRHCQDWALECAGASLERYLRRERSLREAIGELVRSWRQRVEQQYWSSGGKVELLDQMAPGSFLAAAGSERELALLRYNSGQILRVRDGRVALLLDDAVQARQTGGFSQYGRRFSYTVLRQPIPDAILLLTRQDMTRSVMQSVLVALQQHVQRHRALPADAAGRILRERLCRFESWYGEVGVAGYWVTDRAVGADRPRASARPEPPRPEPPAAASRPDERTLRRSAALKRERQFRQLGESRQRLEALERELSAALERQGQMEKQLGYLEQDWERKRRGREKMRQYLERKEARPDPDGFGEGGAE